MVNTLSIEHKKMEEELKRLGYNIIDVKDRFLTHTYHIYAVPKNGYALSICQGIGVRSNFDRAPYSGPHTFEVALGKYINGAFYLVYKGKWKDDVLGWQTAEDVIELAKHAKRLRE